MIWAMGIVAGLDSSSDYTSIVVCDAETGEVLRQGHARHPEGEQAPESWLLSLGEAADGGVLEDVTAIGVTAQQQALVALDADGAPVRPAVAGDDRGRLAATALVDDLGGRDAWAEAVGTVPAAGHPVSKLRWLARSEPEAAGRVATVLQPQDWLVWQLLGRPDRFTTDRGAASATGYWSPATGAWRPDLVELALGRRVTLPEVLAPAESAGRTPEGLLISAGTGETMAAALGLGVGPGDAVISIGTTGSVCAVHDTALERTGHTVTAFADATGRHLPIVRTLNAGRVLRGTAELLGCDLAGLSDLALRSTPGAHGLVLLPYLAGERTPELPHTAGTLAGLRRESMKPEHLARAAVEGMLCGLADAADVLRGHGVRIDRVFLLGPAAELPAVQALAPGLLAAELIVPAPADYAALGAARQAAWALGAAGGSLDEDTPPPWPPATGLDLHPAEDPQAASAARHQFRAVRDEHHPGAFGEADAAGGSPG